MRTCVFIPPVPRYSGGVAVMLELARHLHEAGHEVCLVPRELNPSSVPPTSMSVSSLESLELTANDIWLVPEGWVNALAPGLQAGARCLVYCQNWAYLLSALPENIHWGQLAAEFLAVSAPVAWFVQQCAGRKAPVLRPGIDVQRFAPPEKKPDGPLRVAYMPRKNKALVERVREIVTARSALPDSPFSQAGGLEWVSISGVPHDDVAGLLASSHFFLVSGFPEGCPLPPLEAMASGCFPVGFHGFGGWDYMRQAAPELPFVATPWWPQESGQGPDTYPELGGNGIWVADADVLAAALALEHAVAWKLEHSPLFAQTLENARATALHYSLEQQRKRCLELWAGLTQSSDP